MKYCFQRAWIGLHSKWSWSLSNTSFYKPGETEFRRWRRGEPNNGFKRLCAMMYGDGGWNDISCGASSMPICFDARGPNETFVFINTSMTWTEAKSYCREHHTDLAIVRNLEENRIVQNLVPPRGHVWIGIYRDGWKWSDGSAYSLRNWKTNEPQGSAKTGVAADFSADGLWETLDSNVKSVFICNIDVVPVSMRVVKVRLEKSSSSLDVNDPVVMENLLKQLKQRLEDQGQNDVIKLSWKKQSDGKVLHKEEKESKKKRRDEL
ncbi:Asialoglycoprotein receptor 2 [Liparis tanakae]|uniref:Asialoglycoprotein receptor 2 n=1 Tax=Liparis tanakae TaxID=230148 RepID=A0A4Z2I4X9_9TELE|nr:Asialoglycoprotein receptor 2 [Liparis tanakae]